MDTTADRRGMLAAAQDLAAEFRGFEVRAIRMRDHLALAARRLGGASEPGLYAVITADESEMREALSGDAPPG